MWVHENCGGKVSPFTAVHWGCSNCGATLRGDRSMIELPDEAARQKYISQIERDKFEEMFSKWVVKTYYPQFITITSK